MNGVDPYGVLGAKREASRQKIQKAYHRPAKKLHPDLDPGEPQAEKQFQEMTAAYNLLSDAERRARCDRGEIDAAGAWSPAGARAGAYNPRQGTEA